MTRVGYLTGGSTEPSNRSRAMPGSQLRLSFIRHSRDTGGNFARSQPAEVGGSVFVERIETDAYSAIGIPGRRSHTWIVFAKTVERKNGAVRRRRETSRGWAALLRRRNRKDQFFLFAKEKPPVLLVFAKRRAEGRMERSSRKLSKSQWKPSQELTAALHPSTSKNFVLPRCDRTLFAGYRFVTDAAGIRVDSVVLTQFYQLEKCNQPSSKYFECVQSEVTVHMREILVQWLLEVRCFDWTTGLFSSMQG